MQKQLRTVVSVLAASVTVGILMFEMVGCVEEGVEIPARLEETDPPDGGQIRVDGRLLLRFDHDPENVFVNDSLAPVVGRTATWTATGLTAGQQPTLTLQWQGASDTITLTVIESTCAPSGEGCVDLVSTDPPDGGDNPANVELVMTFSGDPGPVTVNGEIASVSGLTATWLPHSLPPLGPAVLDIVWDDGSATITLTVLEPTCVEFNEACETDEGCCGTRNCVNGFCGGVCHFRGDTCEDDGDCCSPLPCVNGTCGDPTCSGFDEPCQVDSDCCDGLPCLGGQCI